MNRANLGASQRFARDVSTDTLRQILAATEAALAGGADEQEMPDPWPVGEPDPVWEHPAAAEVRRLTREHGLSWEFTTWARFAALIAGIIDERE